MNMNPCCKSWFIAVDAIEIRSNIFDNQQEKLMAQGLTKLMKYTMGQFCPTCGAKVQVYKPITKRKKNENNHSSTK